jgi:hypothetical protein
MDTREIPADDPELQWIAKYRKALDAPLPIRRSPSASFYSAIAAVRKLVTAICRRILTERIHYRFVKTAAITKPGLAIIPKVEIQGPSAQRLANRTEVKNVS